MNKIYKKYAEIKLKIKSLEQEAKELEPKVMTALMEEDDWDKGGIKNKYGTFKTRAIVKWEYSEDLQKKENLIKEKLKIMKKEEEINGKAQKVRDGLILTYLTPKIG